MADFIYSVDGRPQGFRLSNFIYAMDGVPLGRVWAEKVFSFAGEYIGVIFQNMVVDRPDVSRRRLPAVPQPENAAPAVGAELRGPINVPFRDCFELLGPAPAAARSSHP
jgi:hypothetical protein